MIAAAVPKADVKALMNKLLREDAFDSFELRQATVVSFAKFFIEGGEDQPPADGKDQSDAVRSEPTKWSRARPIALGIVRAGGAPKYMKIVFALTKEKLAEVHPNAASLFINIVYEDGAAQITAGSSEHTFSLDRAAERSADEFARGFLRSIGVAAG
ncbi:MAG: DUF5721 family protein [Clostridiales bacterium]|jgi:hypothetical protein|nr:DUF5721 family protein [Clostridiales bacterium]